MIIAAMQRPDADSSNSNYESASYFDEYRRVVHETLAVCRDLRNLDATGVSKMSWEKGIGFSRFEL